MAHGKDDNIDRSTRIAIAAQIAAAGLDADRSKLYFDLILNSLSEAARQALSSMDAYTYEYQSEFARRYLAAGQAEVIERLLAARFGPLSADVQNSIRQASIADLDAMTDRLLVASTLREAVGLR
jgi:hypothetical protein